MAVISSRRHDLDALRAITMLLGIVYHAAGSYAPGSPWFVLDGDRNELFHVFMEFTHGFRMPLFFLISGFFTAMLWRKRGLRALIMHRFKRVFIPCMVSLVIIIPITFAVILGFRQPPHETSYVDPLWTSVQSGDAAAVTQQIADGADIDGVHPEFGKTYLSLAALAGHHEIVELLLEQGADINARNRDGGNALHEAALFGRSDLFDLLIERGADQDAQNKSGQLPQIRALMSQSYTNAIANWLGVEFDRPQVAVGRAEIKNRFNMSDDEPSTGWIGFLLTFPMFLHLWFLWYLCWLVAAFAIVAHFIDRWGTARSQGLSRRLVMSPLALVGWMLLTMIPQWFWGWRLPELYGADTSQLFVLVPYLHGLAYFGLFFAFGAFYYECDDVSGQLGKRWMKTLPVALLVVFPLGLEFAKGIFGFADGLFVGVQERLISDALQVLYAWMMAIACVGMFRSLLVRENKYIRYVSDSSYWLYLAHLPLVFFLQWLVLDWSLPSIVKFALVVTLATGILLTTYEYLIRYTWVGKMLNGPRRRPQPAPT